MKTEEDLDKFTEASARRGSLEMRRRHARPSDKRKGPPKHKKQLLKPNSIELIRVFAENLHSQSGSWLPTKNSQGRPDLIFPSFIRFVGGITFGTKKRPEIFFALGKMLGNFF